jgi:hypothetical protein
MQAFEVHELSKAVPMVKKFADQKLTLAELAGPPTVTRD